LKIDLRKTVDALSFRLGLKAGEDLYNRVMELYLLCKQFREKEIDETLFLSKLDEWWERGE